MWPKGRNIVVQSWSVPIITNDGVTVARSIQLEWLEELGAQLIKEAAEKTNKEAGDGTTTTVVLTHAICEEGLKHIIDGSNPFELTKWLHDAADAIIERLRTSAKQITTKEEIQQVATISAQDEAIGAMIADIIDEVWKDGVVTVDEGHTLWLTKEIKIGMQIGQWYINPYFVTNREKWECVIEDPYIIITDKTLMSMQDILPALELIVKEGKSKDIVIIADNVDSDALAGIIANKLKGLLNIVAVRAPSFWDNKTEILKDLCVVTGATLISPTTIIDIQDCPLSTFGRARKVVVTQDSTTIIGGIGSEASIDKRVAEIKSVPTTNELEKLMQEERVAKLTSWIGIIKVLCATEMETKNKKYKIEDALNATKCAIEEGIVVWGWVALSRIAYKMQWDVVSLDIIQKSILYPAQQILINAWYKDLPELSNEFNDQTDWLNAKTGEVGNMFDMGVIDSCKVLRIALKNAVSAAAMFLTTEWSIINDETKNIQ